MRCWLSPFADWKRYWGEERVIFAHLVEHFELSKNGVARSMMTNFPNPTELIGLQIEDQLFIFEGTQQSCALALAHQKNDKIAGDLQIVIAELDR